MWQEITSFVAVGFVAQIIDGAAGMAYGVLASSSLLGLGIAPATVSACVHAAETFTTAASGYAHWRMGNIDRRLVVRLAVPGMIGGAAGAYALSSLPGESMRGYVSAYLLVLGIVILWRATRGPRPPHVDMSPTRTGVLGLSGGFLDAIGGGGWGPIVTSTLLGNGMVPRMAIGSVNVAAFFVTATISATFLFTIGLELWPIIAGLVIGGVIAAPVAALVARHMPAKLLLVIVGVVVVALSIRGLLSAFR